MWWIRCANAGAWSRIIVAADDKRIAEALRPFGTECMLTDPSHPSGTDRVAEVAQAAGRIRYR
jgi:3-deoxy-manno-octulosonate cytidylyltransferase (CMP-KDO synthetase)